jgi:hypothetical protein
MELDEIVYLDVRDTIGRVAHVYLGRTRQHAFVAVSSWDPQPILAAPLWRVYTSTHGAATLNAEDES